MDVPTDALVGKVAVITGASGGIGKAIALSLAERGSTLCLLGRRRDALQAVASALPCARSIHLFEADLGEEYAVRGAADRVGQQVGRLDILRAFRRHLRQRHAP